MAKESPMARPYLPRITLGAMGLLVSALAAMSGCVDESLLPSNDTGAVRYPIALQADPSGRYVYVAGANFDRKYRAGEVRIIDTATGVWLRERQEIPSFCGELALQTGGTGNVGAVRLFATARDDDSLTALTVTGTATGLDLTCGKTTSAGRCASDYRAGADENKSVGDDPMGVDVAELDDDFLRVTTVGTLDGRVVIRQVPKAAGPLASKVLGSLDFGSGLHSVVTSPLTGVSYISDLRSSNLYTFTVERTGPAGTDGQPTWQVLSQGSLTLPSNGNSDHGRGMALSTDRGRLYVAWRSPASLAIMDIAPGPTGPRNQLLDLIGLGSRPSAVAVAPVGPGGRDWVYVSNFGDNRIWVVDPVLREVVDIIALPSAPYAITTANVPGQGWKLYAGLFSAASVAIVPVGSQLAGHHGAVQTLTTQTEVAP